MEIGFLKGEIGLYSPLPNAKYSNSRFFIMAEKGMPISVFLLIIAFLSTMWLIHP